MKMFGSNIKTVPDTFSVPRHAVERKYAGHIYFGQWPGNAESLSRIGKIVRYPRQTSRYEVAYDRGRLSRRGTDALACKNQTRTGRRDPVSSLDFLPTFCEFAKTEIPQLRLDGASFLPALEGEQIEREHPLFWVYFNAMNQHRVAMRDGDWKVLARLNGGKLPKFPNITNRQQEAVLGAKLTDIEIYNMAEDVSEANDLAKLKPAFTASMRAKLEAMYHELINNSVVWKTDVN